MASTVDRRESFISDILAMITGGTSNDVKIVLNDGEIVANKDVLSARSDYFATMFSNKTKFIEGKTKHVAFNHCSKAVMEKIIQYLFSGSVQLHDLSLSDLVTMMNMTTMMLLDDLKGDIQHYLLEVIPKSGVNCGILPELVESLILAEQFNLDTIKKTLLLELFYCLGNIPHIPGVVKNSDAFKQLPYNLLEDIYFDEPDEDEYFKDDRIPSNKESFDALVFWLSENDCTSEEKKKMKGFFNLDYFTAEDLLTYVKKSGLYSVEEIDRRVLEKCRCNVKEMKELRYKERKGHAIIKAQEHRIKLLFQENEKMKKRLRSTYVGGYSQD